MGSVPAQFEFAAEFAVFLVAAAGVALVLLRAELLSRSPWARACLGLGFVALAAAAFLRGSLLVQPATNPVVGGLRGAGLILLLVGSIRWRSGDASQALVWLGVGLVGAAVVLRGTSGQVADSLLAAGALSIGIALVAASRQVIAARVAATTAATLLVLVFILSLALSQVVSSTVRNDAVRRLDGRASSGATQTSRQLVSGTRTPIGPSDSGRRTGLGRPRNCCSTWTPLPSKAATTKAWPWPVRFLTRANTCGSTNPPVMTTRYSRS